MKPPGPRILDAWGVVTSGRHRGAMSFLRGQRNGEVFVFRTRAKARAAAKIERSLGLAAQPIRV